MGVNIITEYMGNHSRVHYLDSLAYLQTPSTYLYIFTYEPIFKVLSSISLPGRCPRTGPPEDTPASSQLQVEQNQSCG